MANILSEFNDYKCNKDNNICTKSVKWNTSFQTIMTDMGVKYKLYLEI